MIKIKGSECGHIIEHRGYSNDGTPVNDAGALVCLKCPTCGLVNLMFTYISGKHKKKG